jgi:hypothetical protein
MNEYLFVKLWGASDNKHSRASIHRIIAKINNQINGWSKIYIYLKMMNINIIH